MIGSRRARVLSVLLSAVVALGAVACDEQRSGSTPSPTPSPAPSPSPTPSATTGTLVVDDESSSTIFYLYVSPSSTSDWGPDQLGAQVVSPGHSFRLDNVPCNIGTFDLKAEDSSHGEIATHYAVTVGCGRTTTWTIY